MRCDNCGWDNPNGVSRCEKCGSPLSVGGANYGGGAAPTTPAAQNYNKTVNEAVAFPVGGAAQPVQNPQPSLSCPSCGYPLRPGTQVCPQCQTPLNAGPQIQPKPAPAPQQVVAAPTGGTVNPWVQVKQCKFTLTPVKQQGETDTPAPKEFKGEKHALNRDNLDPDNNTITSKVQANIVFENGQWFIQDKSSQKTTFVHVKDKTPLKDGDVILMGNRQFIFKAQ